MKEKSSIKEKAVKDETAKKGKAVKPEKKKEFSPKKAVLILLIAVLAIVLIVSAVIVLSSAYNFSHPEKIVADRFPDDGDVGLFYESETFRFASGDETVLWFIPCQDLKTGDKKPSSVTVIFSHDYKDNKTAKHSEDGVLYAKDLVEEGCNVVLFDYSGSGIATGSGYTFGVREAKELKEITAHIKKNRPEDKIILQGWGFGASAAVMAGAGNDEVTAVIAESPCFDLRSYFEGGGVALWTGLPSFYADGVRLLLPAFFDTDIYEYGPKDALKNKTEQKYLFIGAGLDNVFGKDSINEITSWAQLNGNDVTLWISEKSPHAQGYRTEKKKYLVRVSDFINEACGLKSEEPKPTEPEKE